MTKIGLNDGDDDDDVEKAEWLSEKLKKRLKLTLYRKL